MHFSWCDRKNYKRNFQEWFKANDRFLIIGISDSQELRDIAYWLKSNYQKYFSIGMIHYDSDVDIMKHIILEELITNLGENKRFPHFYQLLKNIEIDRNELLSVKQEIGTQSSAGDTIEFKGVSQSINIPEILYIPPEVFKERHANRLLDEFVNDMKNLKMESFLLIIRFGKNGFTTLSPNFKHWFLHIFCHKIESLQNVKICVLNQGNTDDFLDYYQRFDRNIPGYLDFTEIVAETKTYTEKISGNYIDFCYGVIDPENNNVKYNEFKRKLSAYVMKLNAK